MFVSDERGAIKFPSPTDEIITDALKKGGDLLAFYQSKSHPYIIEEFRCDFRDKLLEYYVN